MFTQITINISGLFQKMGEGWGGGEGGDEFFASKTCHVGIHPIALAENSWISTHMPGFHLFFKVF